MDLKTIFKTYGCCGGDRDDLSVSSTESQKRKLVPPRRNKVNSKNKEIPRAYIEIQNPKSGPSDAHWADLGVIQMPSNTNVPLSSNYSSHLELESADVEDYFTEEPIDFETLKTITQVDKEKNEEKVAVSALAKNSKKIHKDSPAEQRKKPKISLKEKDNSGNKIKRTPWQPEEDRQVLDLLTKYGPRWAKIAATLPGRTGKQVRDRYTNKLKPNINKDEWTKEEEELFTNLCQQFGHKWSKIASFLPGRTEGQVKNKYYAQFRKKNNKDDANDVSPLNLSEGKLSFDQTLEAPDAKIPGAQPVSNKIEVEEPVFQQTSVQTELQKYMQAYIQEGRTLLKDIKDSALSNNPRLFQTTDPTSVISYNGTLGGTGYELGASMDQKYPGQGLNTQPSKKLNLDSKVLPIPPPIKSLQDEDTTSSPDNKIDLTSGLGRELSNYGDMRQIDEEKALHMSTGCCDGSEVLNKCDQLSKRIDSLEFLLFNVLKDIREIRFQENRVQLH